MRSRVFEAFIAPAKARPELWRLVLGVILISFITIGFSIAVILGWFTLADGWSDPAAADRLLMLDGPDVILAILFTFLGPALGVFVATRLLHGRRLGSLFGPKARTLRHFFVAAAIAWAVLGTGLAAWFLLNDARPHLPLHLWAAFLPLAIPAIALQTGAEELIFRGYLVQQLAARFRSPLLWAGLPAVTFGALHFNPSAGVTGAALIVLATAAFALMATDLTVRTGSLGAAWGFHFANNTVALLILATEGSMTGLALYVTPYDANETDVLLATLPADIALMALIWLGLRNLLSR